MTHRAARKGQEVLKTYYFEGTEEVASKERMVIKCIKKKKTE